MVKAVFGSSFFRFMSNYSTFYVKHQQRSSFQYFGLSRPNLGTSSRRVYARVRNVPLSRYFLVQFCRSVSGSISLRNRSDYWILFYPNLFSSVAFACCLSDELILVLMSFQITKLPTPNGHSDYELSLRHWDSCR